MYYQIQITKTSKGIGKKENYQIFDDVMEEFKTKEDVENYLKDNYRKCKRQKMYVDNKDGTINHIGYIYCFRNKDISHNSDWWLQQDWVTVYQVNRKRVII
jgi:hypothetical protein